MLENSNYVLLHSYLAAPELQCGCFFFPLLSLTGQHQEYKRVNSRSPFHTGTTIAPHYQKRGIGKEVLPLT